MKDEEHKSSSAEPENPKERGPKPPYPSQEQQLPGSDAAMRPRPDHGEESYQGSGRLQGRRAIITGGDSGIGRAVAIAFAREGADVLISYLNEEEDARATARYVEEAGRKAVLFPGDISDERHCQAMVDRAVEELGGLDVLVNNAAFQIAYEEITEIPSEEWERHFKVNLFPMFYLCKAAIPHMKPGSTIINTASIESYKPIPPLLPYATTKGAIVTFTQALAHGVAKHGIRANAVAPGPIWTPLIPASFTGEQVSNFGKDTPLGRAGQPAEVAPVYVFLASPESSYVTAAVYAVTGGKFVP